MAVTPQLPPPPCTSISRSRHVSSPTRLSHVPQAVGVLHSGSPSRAAAPPVTAHPSGTNSPPVYSNGVGNIGRRVLRSDGGSTVGSPSVSHRSTGNVFAGAGVERSRLGSPLPYSVAPPVLPVSCGSVASSECSTQMGGVRNFNRSISPLAVRIGSHGLVPMRSPSHSPKHQQQSQLPPPVCSTAGAAAQYFGATTPLLSVPQPRMLPPPNEPRFAFVPGGGENHVNLPTPSAAFGPPAGNCAANSQVSGGAGQQFNMRTCDAAVARAMPVSMYARDSL
eukprot:NODE_2181_length_2274_cov_4.041453.p2 GENE.NODE_2181_length_2274_cov_4.041453~~NODE_2181_length_2274_cov_4.041453.p2  ORF type:complete len:279 (-),score=53.66 NODE_2181_length_2274_cov_4.041453:312-1148(-)